MENWTPNLLGWLGRPAESLPLYPFLWRLNTFFISLGPCLVLHAFTCSIHDCCAIGDGLNPQAPSSQSYDKNQCVNRVTGALKNGSQGLELATGNKKSCHGNVFLLGVLLAGKTRVSESLMQSGFFLFFFLHPMGAANKGGKNKDNILHVQTKGIH